MEKGVLLGEENLHILHADVDYPGSDVGAEGVNTLDKEEDHPRVKTDSLSHANINNPNTQTLRYVSVD